MTKYASVILENTQQVMSKIFSDMLEENTAFEESEGLTKLTGYYQSWKKTSTTSLSDIINDIVNKLIEYVPSEFLSISIDKIQVNAKGKKRSGTFKVHLEKSFVAYIAFEINVDGVNLPEQKLRIEIKPEGNFSFFVKRQDKIVSLSAFNGTLSTSIVDIPFMKLKEPILLQEKRCDIDFSSIDNESKCFGFWANINVI